MSNLNFIIKCDLFTAINMATPEIKPADIH